MGMMLFDDEHFKYVGYANSKHVFENLHNDAVILTNEAKFHFKDKNVTIICQKDGCRVPTFRTKRQAKADDICRAMIDMMPDNFDYE